MTRRNIYTLLSAAILLISLLSGCGGSGTPPPPPPPVISVSVSPGTVSLIAGATQQFTATVAGTSSTAISWSISGCTGSACGAVDATGLYTAPSLIPSAVTVNVVATLQSDTSKTGSAR